MEEVRFKFTHGSCLVASCGSSFAKAHIPPHHPNKARVVGRMAEGLWIEIRGGLCEQPQFKDMMKNLKEPDFDYPSYRAWEDSFVADREAFKGDTVGAYHQWWQDRLGEVNGRSNI